MRRTLAILALVAMCTACSGNDTPVDAGPPDSVILDSAPSVDAPDPCTVYCDCMGMNCPTQFADRAACLAGCATFTEVQRLCRTQHCGFAQADPVFHCPHTVGLNGICE